MAKPKYMRFFPDDYLEDTLPLNMEEQGIYMRLLCLMWTHGGKLPNDDRTIARVLGIHSNKWTKVKPKVLKFLMEHSPGYLTQKRLRKEYRHSVDKLNGSSDTYLDTLNDTPRDTGDNTRGESYGVTAPDTHRVQNGNHEENQGSHEPRGENFSPGELDLEESSGSVTNNIFKKRLEDGGDGMCGKLTPEAFADLFLEDVRAVFAAHKVDLPADNEILSGWIEDGIHPYRHILPSVKKVLARLSGGTCDPPKSWRYFAKEVYRKQKTGGYHGKTKK